MKTPFLLALSALCALCVPAPADPPAADVAPAAADQDRAAKMIDTIARALVEASPPADPGDVRARDLAGEKLAHIEPLLRACGPSIVWTGFDPEKGYDPAAYKKTSFSPMVWAKLYLSTFMFPGEFSIRSEGPYRVLELKADFRAKLEPGEFPYPFWHSPEKWKAYLNAESLILVFEGDQLIAAFRKTAPRAGLPDRRWDGKWQWTAQDGSPQPRVTLFNYLVGTDNPHRDELESSYRALEARLRSQGCVTCHVPDNPAGANSLVLLLYPNQSLGARHAILESIQHNEMPPADPVLGSTVGIKDEALRGELISLAQNFVIAGDAALEFERNRASADAAISPPDSSAWKVTNDDWYSLTLGGLHSGWMRVVREDDGTRYRTTNEMTLSYSQFGTELDIGSYSQWIEGHDGTPIHLVLAKKQQKPLTNFNTGLESAWEQLREGDPMGLLTSRMEWEFKDGQATKIATRGDQTVRVTRPVPTGPWLTPAAAERFIKTRIGGDARALEYGSLDAPEGVLRYVSVNSTLVGKGEIPFQDHEVPTTVWRTRTSAATAPTLSQYSSEGRLVGSSLDLGMGVLETRLAPKADAIPQKHDAEHPITFPLVKADTAFTPGQKSRFQVKLAEGSLPALPSAGAQVSEAAADGRAATVTVDAAHRSPATNAEKAAAAMIERSPIVGSDTALVSELAAQSMKDATDISEEGLLTASHAAVCKRAMARGPAPTLLRPGEEDARLLRAILRMHRIPARLASGLVYSPQEGGAGAFAWQMWTQALIGDQWLDLDPLKSGRFDSGHILLGVSGVAMTDLNPDPSGLAAKLRAMEISVLKPD